MRLDGYNRLISILAQNHYFGGGQGGLYEGGYTNPWLILFKHIFEECYHKCSLGTKL